MNNQSIPSDERATSTDYTRPYRPRLVSCINRAAGFAGLKGSTLTSESLIEDAKRKTGLDDFGPGDFIHRLDLLLDSVNAEAGLNFTGRFMARQNYIRILINRLRIQRDLNRDPSKSAIPMQDPVFVVGLQRTGTTAMQRLISADAAKFRHLASWEAISPAPLKKGAGPDRAKDPRIQKTALARKALQYLAPDFFAIHPVQELDPEEDCLLFDYDFWSTVPEATMRVPSFSRWLEAQDHTGAYRYYRTMLAYLYSQYPVGRWVLKTPQHMEHLHELFTVFPDSTVIQTHRDPVKVIASFCSMISHAYGIFSDTVDPVEIGSHWSAKAVLMVERSMTIREKISAGRFIDVAYRDIVDRPIDTIKKIYSSLGMDFTEANTQLIEDWVLNNPQHKFGKHRYRAEDFGLDVPALRKRFAPYIRKYNIPEERDA